MRSSFSLLGFILLTTGCDSSRSSEASSVPSPASPSASSSARVRPATPGLGSAAPPNSGAAPGALASSVALGAMAPDVGLVLQDGRTIQLSSLLGKHVVLYFYPMDDTPGCRIEAQGFRDRQAALSSRQTVVFGVSKQGAASHQAFIDKEGLNFDLVVDTEGKVAEAFAVPVRAQFAARQTVLVGPKGRIKRIWREVSPATHADQVLAAIADAG